MLFQTLTGVQIPSSLSPLTQKVIALAAKAKNLEEDKDHITINLRKAEDEVCKPVQLDVG